MGLSISFMRRGGADVRLFVPIPKGKYPVRVRDISWVEEAGVIRCRLRLERLDGEGELVVDFSPYAGGKRPFVVGLLKALLGRTPLPGESFSREVLLGKEFLLVSKAGYLEARVLRHEAPSSDGGE
jgi:hypothetical protein